MQFFNRKEELLAFFKFCAKITGAKNSIHPKKFMMKLLKICAAALFFHSQIIRAQTTAFTYQGDLQSGGAPAYGSFDMKFTCFNAVTGGELIGGTITNKSVTVSDGLFSTTLDFGNGVFIGGKVWLEVAVSVASSNSFTTLAPRQPITVAPYALYALSAGTSLTQTNVTTGSVITDSNGVVVTPSTFFYANSNSINSMISGAYVTNNATGVALSGSFNGDGRGLSNVNASGIIGPEIVRSQNGFATNAHLQDSVLVGDSMVSQTFIVNTGTFQGSSLGIVNVSGVGYSDINFFNDGYFDAFGQIHPLSLCGALGVGADGGNQFPYNKPYWELYAQHDFNWVQYAQIFGTVNGTTGDFVWYRNKQSDQDDSSKMFEIVRARTNLSSFVPIIISNTPCGPTASDIGANQAAAIWVSNGVVYVRTSPDGTNTFDKQIAP